MFFFVPALWWTAFPADAPAQKAPAKQNTAAAPLWKNSEPQKQETASFLDEIAPEFLVKATRSALWAMTTSLTKVSTRVYGVCQQLSQALAYDRMIRTMFPWVAPAYDPFDFSELGKWFTGGVFQRAAPNPEPFPFASLFWWTAPSQPAPAKAFNPWASFWG